MGETYDGWAPPDFAKYTLSMDEYSTIFLARYVTRLVRRSPLATGIYCYVNDVGDDDDDVTYVCLNWGGTKDRNVFQYAAL